MSARIVSMRAVDSAGIVTCMAADLRRFEATACENDAIRALFGRYGYLEIAMHVDDALFAARQAGVADAMQAAS